MVGKSIAEKAHDKLRAQSIKTAELDEATRDPAQSGIDPNYWKSLHEKWAKEMEDSKNCTLEGTITDLIDTTASHVYGDMAKDPSRPVIHAEITASDGKKFHETFSHPEGPGSWRNSKFKLGLFLKKYGDLPKVGMKVNVGFDNDGFYTITL